LATPTRKSFFPSTTDRSRWTPKILDILKDKNTPAVFFIIGDPANRRPDILKREYAEGHEIGNHTYFHPRWDEISHTQIRWELNLTQRLIESTLGVKTILFRPPYGIDHQPEYAEKWRSSARSGHGLLIVGQRIDPDDWSMPDGKNPCPPRTSWPASCARRTRATSSFFMTAAANANKRWLPSPDHRRFARQGL